MEAGPLNLVRPEVPVELAAVVAKMMAKEPGRRFQTPGEVAQALTPFFKTGGMAVKGANPEISQAGQLEAEESTPGTARRRCGRSRRRTAAATRPRHPKPAHAANGFDPGGPDRSRRDGTAIRHDVGWRPRGGSTDAEPAKRPPLVDCG